MVTCNEFRKGEGLVGIRVPKARERWLAGEDLNVSYRYAFKASHCVAYQVYAGV